MDTGLSTAIRTEIFGTLADGTAVHRWTLERAGTRVRVLTYGGVVQSVEVPGRDGVRAPVALGLPDLAAYERPSGPYFGALVGRYAISASLAWPLRPGWNQSHWLSCLPVNRYPKTAPPSYRQRRSFAHTSRSTSL